MLRQIFEAEHRAVVDYAQRAKDADGCGETGLKVELENIVVDETRHRDEIEQILAGWDRSEYA
jgi:bacterioferritin